MSKKDKKPNLAMLPGVLISCMTKGNALKLHEKDEPYEVRGPMIVNGTEYPFHLHRHDDDGKKAERTVRIAIDPYRTAKGKPLKPSAKSKPVLAVFCAELHTRSADGTVVTIDVHPVDWVPSLVENPNDD